MSYFQYHKTILNTFPSIVGGIIHVPSVRNAHTPDRLRERYLQEQTAVLQRIGGNSLSDLPSLAAWRAAFRKFGVDPTQYRSAAEALLRRLKKKGDIPSINLLVDIGNLISIRYGIPIAMVDMRAVGDGLRVHFADGSETFTELDAAAPTHPEVGEVVFSDALKNVVARRWCWRQSDASAARADTSALLITVEAHHADGRHDVEAAVSDLKMLLVEYAGAPRTTTAILDRDQPAF